MSLRNKHRACRFCVILLVVHSLTNITSVERISASIGSLARARIIAVMALDIFVYKTPLNAHRDRWICPFSNCKLVFPNPEEMLSHAATCTHVSPNGAYCNCCGLYYDFPGQSPACPVRDSGSAPVVVKDSAMMKGKRKVVDLFSRRSGSTSSSQEQLSAPSSSKACLPLATESGLDSLLASRKGSVASDMSTTDLPPGHQHFQGATELPAGCHVVEIDTSRTSSNSSGFLSSKNCNVPQSTQSTISTVSTTGYFDPAHADYGDFCMSPSTYSSVDAYTNNPQESRIGSVSHATGEHLFHTSQQSQDVGQDSFGNVSIGPVAAEGFDFGQLSMPSQDAQGLMVYVPNFSRPRLPPSSDQSYGAPSYGSHHVNAQEVVLPMAHSQYHYGEGFDTADFPQTEENCSDVGIANGNIQPFQFKEKDVMTDSRPARSSPGFPSFNQSDDGEISCPACDYRPKGAKAFRKANFNKHWRNKHEKTLPWICLQCGKLCKRRDNLLVHQRNVCGKPKVRRPQRLHRRSRVGGSGHLGKTQLSIA
jgi:hypothetical protein